MKVLFLSRKWPPAVGGMELYCRELTQHLDYHGEVDLDLYVLPGNPNKTAPGLGKIALFFARAALFLLFRAKAYDVIHFGDFVLFPLAYLDSLIATRRRRVMTLYGLDLTYGRKRGALPTIYRGFLHWSSRRQCAINCYIAISTFTQQLAEQHGLRNVSVIPLGINLLYYNNARLSPINSREAHQKRCVLYVGRIIPRKGVTWFADHVLPSLPDDIEFFVAGRFYRLTDEKHLKSMNRVKVLGQVSNEDAAALRSEALVVVMPNIPIENSADVEGFGLAALEAPAQCGVLIASKLEGIEDAVIDGVTGIAASPGDADDWIRKINAVSEWSSEERVKFIKKGREALKDRYSWERVAEETVKIYKLALSSSQRY